MMYKFKRIPTPGFVLVESRPSIGDSHIKRFSPGVTPATQGTLNLYLAGKFSVEIAEAGFRQVMHPGQTSLNLQPGATQPGVNVVESAASDGCWRMCLSPENKASRWARRIVDVGSCGVMPVQAGDLVVILIGAAVYGGDDLAVGGVVCAASDGEISSAIGARVAISRLL